MKLTPLQKYKISTALAESSSVLREIKARRLNKNQIEIMKGLESAVARLELFDMQTHNK